MRMTPGVDYTPVTVTLRVTDHKTGRVYHDTFMTNNYESKADLMETIKDAINDGNDLEVIHDD